MRTRFQWLSCFIAALSLGTAIAAPPAASPQDNGLVPLGQRAFEALKTPELATSRCMLSPVFGTDGATVAISFDRVFTANDVISTVAGEQVDPSAKNAVRALLMKHAATESFPVTIKRGDKELIVKASCSDAKPYFDLFLEAAYAASKNDAATCADKMTDAGKLHGFNFGAAELSYQCRRIAGRIVGTTAQAQGFYEYRRLAILEAQWSPDALGRIRGMLLTTVDILRKNNAAVLGDDLKQEYDNAVSKSSLATPTSAANSR